MFNKTKTQGCMDVVPKIGEKRRYIYHCKNEVVVLTL